MSVMRRGSASRSSLLDTPEVDSDAAAAVASVTSLDSLLPELDDASHAVRARALEMMRASVKANHGRLLVGNMSRLFGLLRERVVDTNWNVALLALHLISDSLGDLGPDTELCGSLVLPSLVQRLGDPKVVLRKAALHSLLQLMRRARSPGLVTDAIVKHGLESDDWRVRQAALASFSLLVRGEQHPTPHLVQLLLSVARRLNDVNSDVVTAAQQCVAHIAHIVRPNFAQLYSQLGMLQQELIAAHRDAIFEEGEADEQLGLAPAADAGHVLPPSANDSRSGATVPASPPSAPGARIYASDLPAPAFGSGSVAPAAAAAAVDIRAGSASTAASAGSASVPGARLTSASTTSSEHTAGSDSHGPLRFGFVTEAVLLRLRSVSDWRTRLSGVEQLAELVRQQDAATLLSDFLPFVTFLLDFCCDANFKVSVTSLQALRSVIDTVGAKLGPHVNALVDAFVSRLADNKVTIRETMARALLHLVRQVHPRLVVPRIASHITHRDWHVREQVVNVVAASVLLFPERTEFDLEEIARLFTLALHDANPKVKHVAIEASSVVEHYLKPGIVSNRPDNEDVSDELLERLRQHRLPTLTDDLLIDYSSTVPSSPMVQRTRSKYLPDHLDEPIATDSPTATDMPRRPPEVNVLGASMTRFDGSSDFWGETEAGAAPAHANGAHAPIRSSVASSNARSVAFSDTDMHFSSAASELLHSPSLHHRQSWDEQIDSPALHAPRDPLASLRNRISPRTHHSRHSHHNHRSSFDESDDGSSSTRPGSMRKLSTLQPASASASRSPSSAFSAYSRDDIVVQQDSPEENNSGDDFPEVPQRSSISRMSVSTTESSRLSLLKSKLTRRVRSADAPSSSQETFPPSPDEEEEEGRGRAATVHDRHHHHHRHYSSHQYSSSAAASAAPESTGSAGSVSSSTDSIPPPSRPRLSDTTLRRKQQLRELAKRRESVDSGVSTSSNGATTPASVSTPSAAMLVPPKSTRSTATRLSERSSATGSPLDPRERTSVVENARSFVTELTTDQLKPVTAPEVDLRSAVNMVKKGEWLDKFDNINVLRRLLVHHPAVVLPHLHSLVLLLAEAGENLRSTVSKNAIVAVREMFVFLRKHCDAHLEYLVPLLLKKVSERNFLGEEAELAITKMVQHVTPARTLVGLMNHSQHKNPVARTHVARGLDLVIARMGASVVGSRDVDRLLNVLCGLLNEGSGETRAYTKQALARLRSTFTQEGLDLERVARRVLNDQNYKRVRESLDPQRNRSPEPVSFDTPLDSPVVVATPTTPVALSRGLTERLSRSSRATPSRASAGAASASSSSTFADDGLDGTSAPAAAPAMQLSEAITSRRRSTSSRGSASRTARSTASSEMQLASRGRTSTSGSSAAGLSADASQALTSYFQGMSSTDWRARDEAIGGIVQFVLDYPNEVKSRLTQIFDHFTQRLNDANSKVTLSALDGLNRIMPMLKDSLDGVLHMLVPTLAGNLAATSDKIRASTSQVFDTLTASIDNCLLVAPFVNVVTYGNSRVKAVMVEKLAGILRKVHQKRPQLIIKHVLPALFRLLDDLKGDVRNATASLAQSLRRLLGEQLMLEAQSLSGPALSRLNELVAAS